MDNVSEKSEVVSKNFIESIIDKDLEEGLYSEVVTRFPPETKWIFAYWSCKVDFVECWTCKKIWWKMEPSI